MFKYKRAEDGECTYNNTGSRHLGVCSNKNYKKNNKNIKDYHAHFNTKRQQRDNFGFK